MNKPVGQDTFDPYHKWLGISPKDQPPNYYRLLAIDMFESDADVISSAADKQMAFVRSFQNGKYAQLSQKILNEIATARVCLLTAVKKAQYDAALGARIAAAAAASGIKGAKPIPAVAVVPADDEIIELTDYAGSDVHVFPSPASGSRQHSGIRKKQLKKPVIWPLVALGAMLAACVIAVAVVMLRSPETPLADASAGTPSGDKALPGGKTVDLDNRPQAASNTGKPVVPKNVQRPITSNDDGPFANPASPPKVASIPASSPNDLAPPRSDKNRPAMNPSNGTPGSGNSGSGNSGKTDDPFDTDAQSAPQHEPPAKPAQALKTKTPQELDKELADAQTPDDYQAAAIDALRAAGKAFDDHQQDSVKPLILKSLIAARKSGDSKLIIDATRALTKPESIKEIFAQMDKQEPGEGSDSQLHEPSQGQERSSGDAFDTPSSRQQGTRVTTTKRIGLYGNPTVGIRLKQIRQGTLIALQYDSGAWTNTTTHELINPDDASQTNYRVVIMAHDAVLNHDSGFVLPHGTASGAYQWRAAQDYDSVVVRCNIFGGEPPVPGMVYYRMKVVRPGQ